MTAKASTTRRRSAIYDFTLALTGADKITTDLENALYEHGCDDATLSQSHQRLWLDVTREACSFEEAVLAAVQDVRRVGAAIGLPLDVVAIDVCPLITQAGMARRLGCSRQYVGQLVAAGRKGRAFPAAECHLQEGMPLWRWALVASWLAEEGMLKQQVADEALSAERLNDSLRQTRETPDQLRRPA